MLDRTNERRLVGGGALGLLTMALALVAACSGAAGNASASATSFMQAKTVALPGRLLFTKTSQIWGDVQSIFVTSDHHVSRLTAPGAYCCLLRISPDHRKILVMPGGDIPPPVTGGTINLDGTHFARLQLTDPTLNLVPQAWSPDGKRIAFEGWDDSDPARTGVYTARVGDGGGLIRVTTRPGALHDVPLDYSPDGRYLVFYRAVGVDPDPQVGGSLWVVGVNGSGAHQIASASDRPGSWARWSPDGRQILFANERTAPTGAIWTVAPDGSRLAQLFRDDQGRFPIGPVWSPDGSQVLFALDPTNDAFTHPDNGFYVVSADGTGLALVNGSHDFKSQPEWFATT